MMPLRVIRKTLSLKSDYPEAHNNLGIALQKLGQVDAAVKSFEEALIIKPDYDKAHNNLGNAFKELGQPDDAVKCYEKHSLLIQTTLWRIITSVSLSRNSVNWMTPVKCYEKALTLKPDYAEANNNLDIVLKELSS